MNAPGRPIIHQDRIFLSEEARRGFSKWYSHTWTTTYLSTGSGQTPAHWAAQSGFEEVAAALLAASPLVSLSYDEKGLTPLALAQCEGKPALALRAAEKEEWLELELVREDSLCRPL